MSNQKLPIALRVALRQPPAARREDRTAPQPQGQGWQRYPQQATTDPPRDRREYPGHVSHHLIYCRLIRTIIAGTEPTAVAILDRPTRSRPPGRPKRCLSASKLTASTSSSTWTMRTGRPSSLMSLLATLGTSTQRCGWQKTRPSTWTCHRLEAAV